MLGLLGKIGVGGKHFAQIRALDSGTAPGATPNRAPELFNQQSVVYVVPPVSRNWTELAPDIRRPRIRSKIRAKLVEPGPSLAESVEVRPKPRQIWPKLEIVGPP